jgi:hypothetical protein
VEGFVRTSHAAKHLRAAQADTSQRFLAEATPQTAHDPANRHPYMLDEPSLANLVALFPLPNINPANLAQVNNYLFNGSAENNVDQGHSGRFFDRQQERAFRKSLELCILHPWLV